MYKNSLNIFFHPKKKPAPSLSKRNCSRRIRWEKILTGRDLCQEFLNQKGLEEQNEHTAKTTNHIKSSSRDDVSQIITISSDEEESNNSTTGPTERQDKVDFSTIDDVLKNGDAQNHRNQSQEENQIQDESQSTTREAESSSDGIEDEDSSEESDILRMFH